MSGVKVKHVLVGLELSLKDYTLT